MANDWFTRNNPALVALNSKRLKMLIADIGVSTCHNIYGIERYPRLSRF